MILTLWQQLDKLLTTIAVLLNPYSNIIFMVNIICFPIVLIITFTFIAIKYDEDYEKGQCLYQKEIRRINNASKIQN